MVRIVVTSDTHLGITEYPRILSLVAEIKSLKPDIVAIAGDIGEGTENISVVLEEFASLNVPFCACAGNHDLWNHDKKNPSRILWGELLHQIAESSGAVWLDHENLTHNGVAIVGTVGWYDYSAQDPAYLASPEVNWARKKEFDADAWMIDWPWNDIEFCEMIKPDFSKRLDLAQDDPDVKAIIVVSHMPLFEKQMTRKPGNFKWGFSNAYYGNLTFGKIVLGFSKVTHAIAGHTHSGEDGIIEHEGRNIRVTTLNSQYGDPKIVLIDAAV